MNNPNSHKHQGSVTSYSIGFALSIILTLLAYGIAKYSIFEAGALTVGVMVLAVSQLYVQLHFFIHLGQEQKPRWSVQLFAFMITTIVIIVFGSLWIMNNLDYNMMPDDMDAYMIEQENIKKQ